MQAAEIIAMVRALARDMDYEDLRFGDLELLSYISRAQNELIAEFGENIHIYTAPASESMDFPHELGRIYDLRLDGKPLESAQFAKALAMECACFTHFGGRRYGVLHLDSSSRGVLGGDCSEFGEAHYLSERADLREDLRADFNTTPHAPHRELRVCASMLGLKLEKPTDELELGESYAKALALSCYCDMLLIETNALNLQKLPTYRAELELAKNALRAHKNRTLNAQTIYTRANA